MCEPTKTERASLGIQIDSPRPTGKCRHGIWYAFVVNVSFDGCIDTDEQKLADFEEIYGEFLEQTVRDELQLDCTIVPRNGLLTM